MEEFQTYLDHSLNRDDNPFDSEYAYDVRAQAKDHPDWMKAVVYPEMAKEMERVLKVLMTFVQGCLRSPAAMEPEAMYHNRQALLMLAQAYPERFDLESL